MALLVLLFAVVLFSSLSHASVGPAIYEIWAGNTEFEYLGDESWVKHFYNIDKEDYTKLGDGGPFQRSALSKSILL